MKDYELLEKISTKLKKNKVYSDMSFCRTTLLIDYGFKKDECNYRFECGIDYCNKNFNSEKFIDTVVNCLVSLKEFY